MAGEVVEVGQGVNKFKAGDKVVATVGHAVSALTLILILSFLVT